LLSILVAAVVHLATGPIRRKAVESLYMYYRRRAAERYGEKIFTNPDFRRSLIMFARRISNIDVPSDYMTIVSIVQQEDMIEQRKAMRGQYIAQTESTLREFQTTLGKINTIVDKSQGNLDDQVTRQITQLESNIKACEARLQQLDLEGRNDDLKKEEMKQKMEKYDKNKSEALEKLRQNEAQFKEKDKEVYAILKKKLQSSPKEFDV